MVHSHGSVAPGAAAVCSLRAEYEMPVKTSATICGGRSEFLHVSGLGFQWAAGCLQAEQKRHITARLVWVKMEGRREKGSDAITDELTSDSVFLTFLILGDFQSRWQIRYSDGLQCLSSWAFDLSGHSGPVAAAVGDLLSVMDRPSKTTAERDPGQLCTWVPLECLVFLFLPLKRTKCYL